MPALSNTFRIDSFFCFRQVYISTIQRAYRGFKSNIFTDTFTSPGATPFFNYSLTRPVYHEFMGGELLYFLIDRNTKMLEIVAQIIRYNSQLAIIFQMQYLNFDVILTFEGTDHHLWVLLLWVTKLFLLGFEVEKEDFLKQSDTFFIIGPIIWSEGNIKATREIILGYTTLSFTIIDKLDR